MRLDDLYLVDIIEAYESLLRMIGDATQEVFAADEKLISATQMKLMIMGEALSSMKASTRDAFTEVPVGKVRGLRNRIVHGYFTIDDREIFEIATMQAPALAFEAERVLAVLFPDTHQKLQQRRSTGVVE